MVEKLNLHEDFVEYIAMNYMLHNMIVFRILILLPIADPLVVTVVRKSDVNVHD